MSDLPQLQDKQIACRDGHGYRKHKGNMDLVTVAREKYHSENYKEAHDNGNRKRMKEILEIVYNTMIANGYTFVNPKIVDTITGTFKEESKDYLLRHTIRGRFKSLPTILDPAPAPAGDDDDDVDDDNDAGHQDAAVPRITSTPTPGVPTVAAAVGRQQEEQEVDPSLIEEGLSPVKFKFQNRKDDLYFSSSSDAGHQDAAVPRITSTPTPGVPTVAAAVGRQQEEQEVDPSLIEEGLSPVKFKFQNRKDDLYFSSSSDEERSIFGEQREEEERQQQLHQEEEEEGQQEEEEEEEEQQQQPRPQPQQQVRREEEDRQRQQEEEQQQQQQQQQRQQQRREEEQREEEERQQQLHREEEEGEEWQQQLQQRREEQQQQQQQQQQQHQPQAQPRPQPPPLLDSIILALISNNPEDVRDAFAVGFEVVGNFLDDAGNRFADVGNYVNSYRNADDMVDNIRQRVHEYARRGRQPER